MAGAKTLRFRGASELMEGFYTHFAFFFGLSDEVFIEGYHGL